MKSRKIISVLTGSIADRIGIKPGDALVSINSQALRDIIDYSFAVTEERLTICIEHQTGETKSYKIKKSYDEGLGIEFESAVFDGIRSCANRCPFCFVEQVPPNMRSSLYIKDDDYRMSFLYGNFITMTNMVDNDFKRIAQFHLSPLFISVHTMNMQLRAQLLHTKRGALLLEQLDTLEAAGIDYHTQVVLCPGLNDGPELSNTIEQLISRRPYAQSVAIVPVGLTKYRSGCQPLRMFDAEGAKRVIEQVREYQLKLREQEGEGFVYLGDEFYFLADEPLPATEEYDGFPQLDNGIGLARNFIDDWESAREQGGITEYSEKVRLLVLAGTSIAPMFKTLISQLQLTSLSVTVLSVKNDFFGHSVNVSGLLTGIDIRNALSTALQEGSYDGAILPACSLRAGENIFLDDYSLEQLQADVPIKLRTALSGSELYKQLTHWKAENDSPDSAGGLYTWQSNAAYTQVRGGKENE